MLILSHTMITALLVAINAATYFMFWYDKHCAKRGQWRVTEAGLLLLALLGGSPAAYIAMRQLRHKTRKTSFRMRFWLVLIVQLGFLIFGLSHML